MTFQIKNVKSNNEYDVKYFNGTLRFTKTKIMVKYKWKSRFKAIMDKKAGRWGCTFKKKHYREGIFPFIHSVIKNLETLGIEIVMFDVKDVSGIYAVNTTSLLRHFTEGQGVKRTIYYNLSKES